MEHYDGNESTSRTHYWLSFLRLLIGDMDGYTYMTRSTGFDLAVSHVFMALAKLAKMSIGLFAAHHTDHLKPEGVTERYPPSWQVSLRQTINSEGRLAFV